MPTRFSRYTKLIRDEPPRPFFVLLNNSRLGQSSRTSMLDSYMHCVFKDCSPNRCTRTSARENSILPPTQVLLTLCFSWATLLDVSKHMLDEHPTISMPQHGRHSASWIELPASCGEGLRPFRCLRCCELCWKAC